MSKFTIGVINPIITKEFEVGTREEAKKLVSADVDVKVFTIRKGPASIECYYDEVCAVPGILEIVEEIEEQVDSIVVNCFGDPGLGAAREITNKPVVGPGSASMLMASLLGANYSVITVLDRLVNQIKELAFKAGALSKLNSIRGVDLPVLDLDNDKDLLVNKIVEESLRAIEEDGSEGLVLGCTGMAGLAEAVKAKLYEHGYNIPVLDPFAVAVRQAEVLAKLGISHSKVSYGIPPKKERIW